MVLARESIFSRTSLDGRPRNLQTFSKVNLKYTKRTFPVGQARCSFHLPHSYNLQILLARGNGASTNVEPCYKIKGQQSCLAKPLTLSVAKTDLTILIVSFLQKYTWWNCLLIRSQTTTLFQILGKLLLYLRVIFKSMRVADNIF